MIKSDNGKVRIEGNVADVLEEFTWIVSGIHEMLASYSSEDASRRIIANTCYVATHELSFEEADKVAQDTADAFRFNIDKRVGENGNL